MSRVTIYCVQPFWRAAPTKLARGDMRQFICIDEARRVAAAALRRNAGVIVYKVEGSPEFDTWQAPKLVCQMGEVPAVRF